MFEEKKSMRRSDTADRLYIVWWNWNSLGRHTTSGFVMSAAFVWFSVFYATNLKESENSMFPSIHTQIHIHMWCKYVRHTHTHTHQIRTLSQLCKVRAILYYICSSNSWKKWFHGICLFLVKTKVLSVIDDFRWCIL